MDWRDKVFKNFKLYGVTDLQGEGADTFWRIEHAFRGGADIIQLRSKVLSDAALLRLGLKVKRLAIKYRRLFFINDRVDLALAAGADGVHLGQEDMPVAVAWKLVRRAGRKFWIGKSTHSLGQALTAVREGADYIGVGPVFATPTKPHMRSVGLRFVRQAAAKIPIPWVAIGGIDLKNIRCVIDAGATRVAVVRALFAAESSENAAKKIKQQLFRQINNSTGRNTTCQNRLF